MFAKKTIEKRGCGFDIVKTVQTINPPEMHLIDQTDDGKIKKASYCGPFTKLEKRLKDFNPKTGRYSDVITKPINKLDEGCMKHDLAYVSEDLNVRHEADKELLKLAEEIINDPTSTNIQKINSKLVDLIMKGKIKFGVGMDISERAQTYMRDKVWDPAMNVDQNTSNILSVLILAGSVGVPLAIKLWNSYKKKQKEGKGFEEKMKYLHHENPYAFPAGLMALVSMVGLPIAKKILDDRLNI